jgi:phosphatidylethanolamine/phosphatidyl-N-methylethanolamine N-methyltransferase
VKQSGSLLSFYFDRIYNPLYDWTTARFDRYVHLQRRCVDALAPEDLRSILCVGLGTGNEILHIASHGPGARIQGVDISEPALRRARRKLRKAGLAARLARMDAHALDFRESSFDGVLCIHLMDFARDPARVTREIVRVLRPGGRLVATYPFENEGVSLAGGLYAHTVRQGLIDGTNPLLLAGRLLLQLASGFVYLPLVFRSGRRPLRRTDLSRLLESSGLRSFTIEEDRVYGDLIARGVK